MPVIIWRHPGGDRDRAEVLKEQLENLEKKGTVGNVIALHDAFLIQWTPRTKVRETRTTRKP